jgi:hypothetical protein
MATTSVVAQADCQSRLMSPGDARLIRAAAWVALSATLCACEFHTLPLENDVMATQIAQQFTGYQCADYFTVGAVQIKDKLMNAPPAAGVLGGTAPDGKTSDAVVEAYTPLAKTEKYVNTIEHAGLFFALAPCSDDFLSPGGRFRNLAVAFRNTAVGVPVNFDEKYRFQKWQSGWRIKGIEP